MVPVRQLGETERGSIERILDADPYAAAQVAERVAARGLAWWRAEGRIFGYGSRRHVESLCWLGGHLTPVRATPPAVAAFAERIAAEERTCSSHRRARRRRPRHVGAPRATWGPARDVRPNQPLLVADTTPTCPRTRPCGSSAPTRSTCCSRPPWRCTPRRSACRRCSTTAAAATAGASPSSSAAGGRTPAIVDGEVVFKAELAVVTRRTAQIQGVWVAPALARQGARRAGARRGRCATRCTGSRRRSACT